VKVTFWGVRGSIASPGRATAEYGGNTSCVEVQVGNETFILDCGTGMRELGRSLVASGNPVNATIMISHSHWDHIQGFPFFGPLFFAGNQFTVLGPQEHTNRLNETLGGQMQYRYFPIGLDQLAAEIRYQEVREEKFTSGSAVISTHYLNHTLMAMAYKIEAGGRSVAYATDTEPFSQQARAWESSDSRKFLHKGDAALAEFVSGCDVLILDTQYTAHEYPTKVGWGHSTADYAIDIAISAGVNTLVLFHHEPTRVDTAVTVLEQLAQRRVREECPELEVYAAAEGLTLELEDAPGHELPATERHLPQFHPRVRIAVIGSSENFMGVAWKALAQDHYEVVALNGLSSLRAQELSDFQPHLVVLEQGPEGWDPQAGELIQREHRLNVPVISVVPAGRFEYAQEAFNQGASDVIIEPFASTQLRSRVDSWLMRSGVAVDRRVRGRPAGGLPAPVS
jgi:phosphoribosyl 1,2-cyclic phosphodiesterase